jgi:CRISPR-associated protein Cas2
MWVLVLFDLPTDTKEAKDQYRYFRESLLEDGYQMLQYSVYSRPCPSEENANTHSSRIQRILPPDGHVRILTLTDKQFERMIVFFGKVRHKPE